MRAGVPVACTVTGGAHPVPWQGEVLTDGAEALLKALRAPRDAKTQFCRDNVKATEECKFALNCL
jgi:hypothetical protein